MNAMKWYAGNTGNDFQGLVIDESDGRTVAVAYGRDDMPLIAAAPELLAALIAVTGIGNPPAGEPGHVDFHDGLKLARAALAKATGAA